MNNELAAALLYAYRMGQLEGVQIYERGMGAGRTAARSVVAESTPMDIVWTCPFCGKVLAHRDRASNTMCCTNCNAIVNATRIVQQGLERRAYE